MIKNIIKFNFSHSSKEIIKTIYQKQQIFSGKMTLYRDSHHKNQYYSLDEISKMKNKGQYVKISHVFTAVRINGNGFLAACHTSKKETYFSDKVPLKNIPHKDNFIKYSNPLWYGNWENLTKYAKISSDINTFPLIFKNQQKNLAQKLYLAFLDSYKHSLFSNQDPISFDLSIVSMNSIVASYHKNESKVLVSSCLGVLNKFHSKIFLEKTKISFADYSEINKTIGNQGLMEKDITNSLDGWEI